MPGGASVGHCCLSSCVNSVTVTIDGFINPEAELQTESSSARQRGRSGQGRGGWAAGAGSRPCPEPHVLCACQAVESVQAEDESAQLCKRRIEHLKEHSSDQPAAAGLWKRKRMDRMMAEHLLRCGYYNTAVRLARQSGIEVGACVPTGLAAVCPQGTLCSTCTWGAGQAHGQRRSGLGCTMGARPLGASTGGRRGLAEVAFSDLTAHPGL